MEKRGQAKILTVILIILLIFALIVVLWNILVPLIKGNLEVTEIKARLIRANFDLKDVDEYTNEDGDKKFDIAIWRGPEKLVLERQWTQGTLALIDLVSVVDVSDSMGDDCDKDTTSKLCLAKEANLDLIENIFDRNINHIPVNKGSHSIGLVSYGGVAGGEEHKECTVFYNCNHELVTDSGQSELENVIGLWGNKQTMGGTCICCGISNATEFLEQGSNKLKFIILMSDGVPTVYCPDKYTTADATKDAYSSAIVAADAGITIYTIGIGVNEQGEKILQDIAEIGHGTYFDAADISEIEDIYSATTAEIIREYRSAYDWDHLRIIFFNEQGTASCSFEQDKIPDPLETKTYTIPDLRDFYDECGIGNIGRIEVYMVAYTSDGDEVWSPLLGEYDVKD